MPSTKALKNGIKQSEIRGQFPLVSNEENVPNDNCPRDFHSKIYILNGEKVPSKIIPLLETLLLKVWVSNGERVPHN
jgi:hypothetical protein